MKETRNPKCKQTEKKIWKFRVSQHGITTRPKSIDSILFRCFVFLFLLIVLIWLNLFFGDCEQCFHQCAMYSMSRIGMGGRKRERTRGKWERERETKENLFGNPKEMWMLVGIVWKMKWTKKTWHLLTPSELIFLVHLFGCGGWCCCCSNEEGKVIFFARSARKKAHLKEWPWTKIPSAISHELWMCVLKA